MTVKELFKKSDSETVYHAYTLVRPVFDDLDNHTMQEKAKALKKLRKHIEEVCVQFRDCRIEKCEKPKTLFVIGRTRTDWGESHIEDMECFTTYDDEAKEAVKTNFTMWNDNGDVKLEFYGIDFQKLNTVAGYTIAQPSVCEYGIDVCCAVILRDIFLWGLTEEKREENKTDLTKRLQEAEKNYEEGRFVTEEEISTWLDNEFLENASDDVKEHNKYEHEFRYKVMDIENRYREEIYKIDHQRFIDMVRKEYEYKEK